jgi:hypothetical protein
MRYIGYQHAATTSQSLTLVELFRPFRVRAFVQAHAHGIMLLNAAIEYAFHSA